MNETPNPWNGALVRTWLESRVIAARADQVAAERYGYERRDDCDKAAAEEMICAALKGADATSDPKTLADTLKDLLGQDEHVWRGVYDDARFDRHVRTYIRKLLKMTRTNEGFANTRRYQ